MSDQAAVRNIFRDTVTCDRPGCNCQQHRPADWWLVRIFPAIPAERRGDRILLGVKATFEVERFSPLPAGWAEAIADVKFDEDACKVTCSYQCTTLLLCDFMNANS